MDELDGAINTYRVLILGDDPYEIVSEDLTPFFFDIISYPDIDYDSELSALEYCLEVFLEEEHYEKCADLRDHIKTFKNGI